ncbi:unnamed protein product, partial [Rotaria magnacalcarata]
KAKSNPTLHFHIVDLEQIQPTSESLTQSNTTTVASGTETSSQANLLLIWCDADVNKSKENIKLQAKIRQSLSSDLKTFENMDQCEMYIRKQSNDSIILIVSGQYGRQIMPNVYELSQLIAAFVYCSNKEAHIGWSKDYYKIKAVLTHSDKLINALISEEEQSKQNTASPSTHLDMGLAKYLSPIKGYEDCPLMSLEEVVHPIRSLIGETEKLVYQAKHSCKEGPGELTLDEMASIYLYTMAGQEKSFYSVLNTILRSEERKAIKPWFPYLKLLMTALHKLKSRRYESCWRGIRGDLSAQFPIGTTGVWWTLTSVSTERSVVEHFMGSSSVLTLFSIECKAAKYISPFSYFPREDEVLLMPGFAYQVIDQYLEGSDIIIIRLKEIQSLY